MKKKINTRVFAAVALLPLFQAFAATAVNDGLFFDLGIRGDINQNGKADADEVVNLMTMGREGELGKVQHGLPTSVEGQDPVKFEILKDTINNYYQISAVTNDIAVLKFSQEAKFGTDGTYSNAQQTVRLNDNYSSINERSGFVRFRWDGYAFTNKDSVIIFGDCFSWGDNGGFSFFIHPTTEKLMMWNGKTQTKYDYGCKVVSNQWHDLLFRIGNNGVNGTAKLEYLLITNGVVRQCDETFTNSLNMANGNLQRVNLGGQDSNDDKWYEYGIKGRGNTSKAFKGAIASLKLWNRILSDEEFLAVRARQDGMQWTIGAKNGSADEFGGSPKEEFDPVIDAWSKMKKSLVESDKTLTLKTKMGVSDVGLQKSLRVIPLLSSGATGDVKLSVNGTDVESACFEDGKEHVFVIPAGLWVADDEGYVTVTLSRTGEVVGTLSFDALSLSGGWQIGYADWKANEFMPNYNEKYAPEDFFVGDADISNHVRKAVYSIANSTSPHRLYLHFWVDERMAKNASAVYSTRISGIGSRSDGVKLPESVEVYLNGNCIHQTEIVVNDGITVPIERGTMNAGLNTVEFRNCSNNTGVWMKQDYFRLEFKREYSPFVFLIR